MFSTANFVVAVVAAACGGGDVTTGHSAGDWPAHGLDHANSVHNHPKSVLSPDKLSELTEAWRLDGIGGVTGTPAVVNGVVYCGDWHGVVHLLERYYPVRGGLVDNLAAKR
jgi:hypothetical protein